MKIKLLSKIPKLLRNNSKKEEINANQPPKTVEYERCIICGNLTRTPISMPINRRKNYQLGCGQICDECAKNIRKISE